MKKIIAIMSSLLLLTSCGSNPIADIANSIDSCKTVMSAAGAYSDAAMTLLENPSDQAALDKLKSLGSDLSALAGKVNDPEAKAYLLSLSQEFAAVYQGYLTGTPNLEAAMALVADFQVSKLATVCKG
jgi:hypothetical protein